MGAPSLGGKSGGHAELCPRIIPSQGHRAAVGRSVGQLLSVCGGDAGGSIFDLLERIVGRKVEVVAGSQSQ